MSPNSAALHALLASALLIAIAGATEFDAGVLVIPPSGEPSADAPPQEAVSPCACAAKPRCWKWVMIMDAKMVSLHEEEIEKALPNRFFPATLTFALRRPTPEGHFLAVKCSPAHRICTDKRDILEERVIKSSLLTSLPLNLPEGTLYDPETLKLTEAGEKTFEQTKECRKTLLTELAAVVLGPGAE